MRTDPELDAIKKLDLIGYFAHLGFERNPRKSSRLCSVLRRGSDVVLVTAAPEGHQIWSTGEKRVGGSILDAAMKFVPGCRTLGHARGELRPWLAGGLPYVCDAPTQPPEPDRLAVVAKLSACRAIGDDHAFLASRSLPAWVINSPHLRDRLLADHRGNAVFVYHDKVGPCGLELRNTGFKGFTEGSVKGLWFAQDDRQVETLVLAESPIDALSVVALQERWEGVRLVALGGTITERQRELLTSALERLPAQCLVRLCFDRDDAGERYCGTIQELLRAIGRDDLAVMRDPPRRKDYNEDLAATFPLAEGPGL